MRTENAPTDPDWCQVFLARFAETHNVSDACRLGEISREAAFRHRAQSPAFRQRWTELEEDAVDRLEAELRRRAFVEDDRASHTLLMFLIKAHRPQVYGDRRRAAADAPEEPEPFLATERLARLTADELDTLESLARKLSGEG